MLIYESNLVNFPKRQHIKGKKKKKWGFGIGTYMFFRYMKIRGRSKWL